MIMGKYFGTDGFRGEANVVLTVEHAFKVGRYLGWYFGQDHKARVVIGKDTRRSSYMFEYALAAGITASGADAYLLHVTTTPSVSYVVRTEDFDCGIMISASHNPFYDNGIKVINSAGHKMEAEVEDKIEAYIDGEIGELPLATKENIGRTIDYSAGRNRYIGHLISIATRSFKDMRIGLDCANGSSFAIAKSVFDALGAKTYVINNEPDGTNINTNCGSTHINVLQEFVKEKKLDVGFAYDGDADRCIAVDENGNVVGTTTEFNADRDSQIVGCASPLFSGGLVNTLRWKNLSLSFNFNFVYGNKIYNYTRITMDSDGAYSDYNQMSIDNGLGWSRWENPGDIATHPKLQLNGNNMSNSVSSRYLEDGSYLRLKNVTLGYTLPKKVLKKMKMQDFRIFLSGDNLFTVSRFSGTDPEVRLESTDYELAGMFSMNYPVGRVITLGVNFKF